jgi:hypothetical protein
MRQVRIRKPKKSTRTPLDMRSPSGKTMPY